MFRVYVLFALLLLSARHSAAETVITNFSDLCSSCQAKTRVGHRFAVTGRLVGYYRRPKTREWIITVTDGRQNINAYEINAPDCKAVNIDCPQLNDLVRLSGRVYVYQDLVYPGYSEAQLISRAVSNSPVIDCDGPDVLFNHNTTGRLLRAQGTIRDFFRDESDPTFIHMSLCCRNGVVHAMILQPADEPVAPEQYVGAIATVTGIGEDARRGLRRHMGRFLGVSGIGNVVLNTSTNGPSSLADFDDIARSEHPPSHAPALCRAEGDVLCAWQRGQVLIRTKAGNIAKVRLIGKSLPRFGQKIRVCGIPETDLYFMNLVNATWEQIGLADPIFPPLENSSLRNLLFNEAGYPMIKIREHGNTIRLTGIVRYQPRSSDLDSRFHVESDGCLVPVDVGLNKGLLKELVVGSKVSVTGVCVLDVDSYGIGASIPQARGFFLVLRTPNDLIILSQPSWWTPLRLLIVIGALVLALTAVAVWNLALKRLSERRGRQLADEQVGRVTSELKVYERTHLAVELHDALSQTLSGVSMQIDAVGRFAETDKARMIKHLGIAAKTLKSCRDELRNCLLDLRSSALEETDMNVAIRRTLAPSSDGIDIAVRFDVPRDLFSDNTAHTILRIIRELVTNAIRHGHADKIKVAGSIENDVLKFSVRDNGCGFDPNRSPGIADGHFGLQGIRERIESYEGTFTLSSKPGSGSKATVAIRLPSTSEKELSNG